MLEQFRYNMNTMNFFRVAFLLLVSTCFACAQTIDEFSDGDDDGWARYDPFAVAADTPNATFDPSGGTYRISMPPTPIEALGQARAAAFRSEIYTDFWISVDVPTFDLAPEQAFGVVARVQPNPGPGAVNGYAMTYHPADDDIQITLLENEQVIEISSFEFLSGPIPEGGLRLVFFGIGNLLVGRAYDPANPLVPLAETCTIDDTHASGISGLVVADNTETGDDPADATFDNFFASASGIPKIELDFDGDNELGIIWKFPFLHHDLTTSSSMVDFEPADFPNAAVRFVRNRFEYFIEITPDAVGNRFFRLETEELFFDE